MRTVIVAEEDAPTVAPETVSTRLASWSTSGVKNGATDRSTEAAPAGIVSVETPGAKTAARPSPENATSNVSAGSPVGSASARETRKTPGASVPSSASERTVTASAPAWNASGQGTETTVPLADVARTVAACVPAASPETTAEYVAGSAASVVVIA